ncbi:unnamed protein product, partial [Brassica oleracea]
MEKKLAMLGKRCNQRSVTPPWGRKRRLNMRRYVSDKTAKAVNLLLNRKGIKRKKEQSSYTVEQLVFCRCGHSKEECPNEDEDLTSQCLRKMDELQAEYQRKFHEVEAG